jgi:predicted DNA-binding transcriptional regulator AlpA
MSRTIRWARNAQLARYAGVSDVTLWKWRKMPDFPPPAVINNTPFNDLDRFDAWMTSHIVRPDAEPRTEQADEFGGE